MKTATIVNQSFSRKQMTYVALGVVGLLTVVGVILGFFTLQRVTRASEEAPQNVAIAPNPDSAKVTWETGNDTIAVVEYGTTPDPATFTKFAFSETPTKEHAVDMSSLDSNTTYFFQIRVGDSVYDNGGQLWTFTTPQGESTTIPTESTTPEPSEKVENEPDISATVVPTPTEEISPDEEATPTEEASGSGEIEPTETNSSVTPTPSTSSTNKCSFTDCKTIQRNLGVTCNTQDYIRCIFNASPNPSTATSPSPTPLSAFLKSKCSIDYFQSNSCKAFSWRDVTTKDPACENVYKNYFVQCKSNSFNSTDAATWYCNERVDKNDLTVPCASGPTPAPGQSVFCRVRAETATGGSADATQWVYTSTSCSSLSSSIGSCAISYLQANNCRSMIWDSVNNTNPTCSAAFDKYFLQCTSNGDYTGATGTWYCNTTSENHYVDMPCYNAPTPADGQQVYCRVRAEDAAGGDSHATSWVTTTATCPTSTPTPTPTMTPTNTITPTP